MLYVFWTLTLVYFVFGTRVDQWTTHKLIGLSLEMPLYFHKNPRAYALVRIVLLFAAAGALILANLTWYYGLAVLVAAWFGTTWLGQRLAFAKYRKIALYLARTADTEKEKAERLKDSLKTDDELRDMAMITAKFVK